MGQRCLNNIGDNMREDEDFDRKIFKKWKSYREAVENDVAAAILVLSDILNERLW